jgi:hypothetical protein
MRGFVLGKLADDRNQLPETQLWALLANLAKLRQKTI